MQEIPGYYYALLAIVAVVTFLTNFIFNIIKSRKDKKQEALAQTQLEESKQLRDEKLIKKAVTITTEKLNGRLVKNEEDIKHLNYRIDEQKADIEKLEMNILAKLAEYQSSIFSKFKELTKKLDDLFSKVYEK